MFFLELKGNFLPVTRENSNHDVSDKASTAAKNRKFINFRKIRPIVPLGGGEPINTLSWLDYRRIVMRKYKQLPEGATPFIARRLYWEFFFNGLLDKAAILSFFTLLTALPTLLSFYAISSLLLDQNRDQVTTLTEEFITSYIPEQYGDTARSVVNIVIGSTQQSAIMLILSILFALFSSSAYVRAFSRTSNELYGRIEGRTLLRTWGTMWGLTFMLLVGLVILAGAYFLRGDIVTPLVDRFAEPLELEEAAYFFVDRILPVWGYLRWPVIIVVALTLVAVLYHVAPNANYGKFRWITPGSVFALSGVFIVGVLTQIYASSFGQVGLYGALGGLVTALIGIWLANAFMLLGIALNVEVARVRELQAGLDSEKIVRVPPRSARAIDDYNRMIDDLVQRSRSLKQTPSDVKE